MTRALEFTEDARAWRGWLEAFPDAGPRDTPEWAGLMSIVEPGKPACVRFTAPFGQLLLPFLLRPIRDGLQDVFSPYDFGGHLFAPGSDVDTTFESFLPAWRGWCSENAVVSEFLRMHPFREWPTRADAHVETHQDHVVIDLAAGYGNVAAAYDSDVRRCLRKAERAGVSGRRVEASQAAGSFATLYAAAMDRLRAPRFYHFPVAFFERLFQRVPQIELWAAFREGAAPLAAAIFMRDGVDAFYFLSATDPAGRASHPNQVVIDAFVRSAVAAGCRRVHLGGGAPALRNFKESFSTARVPYYVRKQVHDPASYERLVALTDRNVREALPGHFPLYRAEEFLPRGGDA